ncbi:TolC family protein [Seohaeicola zhoushanensis]
MDASYRVRIAAIEVERAKYEGAVVEADRMPRLSLNAGAKAGRDIDGSAGPQTDTYIGLRLNWILHKGGRDAERNAWVERKSKALAEQHVAVGEVRELAQRTWNSYIANGDRVHLLSAQLNVNRDLVGQYQSEFEAGTRSLLEVLDAEQSAFNVEFEGISAQAAYTFSIYRMLAAQSRLAKHFGVKPSNTALVPDFRERALANPTSVFKTEIPPME